MTDEHKIQSKAQVIQNIAYWSSTQASYTIGAVMTMQENQPAALFAARHNIKWC